MVILCIGWGASASAADFMFQAQFADQLIEGKPLFWNDAQMLLLARDGALHQVDPRQATEAKRTAARFAGLSTSQMRSALYQEFGKRITVTSTGHYLVVHHPGDSDAWGQRFEQLYRSFQNYFRVRGFRLSQPQFPLVAIIYPTQDEYYRQSRAGGRKLPAGTLGHYDNHTNRVLMYDRVGDGDRDWAFTANTIVHEATHQTAFNTGLHSRTASTPQWLVEGIATMFEARGVYQSQPSDTRGDRINRGRFDDYRYFRKQSGTGQSIVELVASDQPFRTAPERAYANAWALTFYLSETRPREYERYLARTSQRPPLSKYATMDRVRDFQAEFGADLELLESQFHNWMDELR